MARVSKEQPEFASFVKNDLGIWKFLQKQPTRQAWNPSAKPPSLPNRIDLTVFWFFGVLARLVHSSCFIRGPRVPECLEQGSPVILVASNFSNPGGTDRPSHQVRPSFHGG